ncbi:MAG: hypothetical protein IJX67_08250 [Oscillospiraceae bacterium]|nr:hypothetical protein [Oscillospiraceae bacterium]
MKKKLLTGLLALAISFALWFYVITVVSPGSDDTFHNIPVIFDGESVLADRELIITSVQTGEVTLKLEGNRTDLSRVDRSNIDVIVDLTKIYSAGTYRLRFDVSYPGDVPADAFSILEQNPAEIIVVVENRKSNSVPVKIEYQGAVPEGFVADKENAVLDYSKITITGPESVIDQIASAKINVDLSDRKESIVGKAYPITLCDKDGNPVDVSLVTPSVTEVQLDVKIQQWEDIKLLVNVIEGGGATAQNSKIEIFPETIKVAGSEAALKQITSGIEIAEINLGALEEDTTLNVSLDALLPEGVTNLSGTTEVQVKVSFSNLMIKEFSVDMTDVELVNVPEGMEVELLTEALAVKVRGTIGQLNSMTADDISVKVDFSNVPAGTATVKAEIVIADKYADVGEMGTYSVYADLRQKSDKNK